MTERVIRGINHPYNSLIKSEKDNEKYKRQKLT